MALARGKVTILGVPWTYKLLTPRAFQGAVERATGDGPDTVAAFTSLDTKWLVFCSNDLNLETIRHELMHAYINTLPYFNQGLCKSVNNYEEMVCDLVGSHGALLVKQAHHIHQVCRRALK